MSDTDPTPLPEALAHADPAVRAAAIARVRYRDLKDPTVLRALLLACADTTPAPGAQTSGSDPFAAFFSARAAGATVGELAAERVQRAGIPEDLATAELIAKVLDEVPADQGHALPGLAAKLYGESSWPDPIAATRTLVPALDRHDTPLFEALVRLPSVTTPAMVELATEGKLRTRLLQELLNHPPTHDPAVKAATAAVLDGRTVPDDTDTVTLLATLSAWSAPSVVDVARHLLPRFPWASAWGALDDPDQVPALEAWLAAGAPDIDRLWPRISEAVRHREATEGYPIAALLRAAGRDGGVIDAWNLQDDPGVIEVLRGWVDAWGEDLDRAWMAARVLVGRGHHGPVVAALTGMLAEREPERFVPWDAGLLEALAKADPEVAGIGDAVLAGLTMAPAAAEDAVPALLALSHAACRRAVEAVLAAAEAAPWETTSVGPGTVREGPRDIDVSVLAPVLTRLADPELDARQDRMAPVIHAARQE
ncbi:MAG: hypothetical protein KC621_19215 [Myxococcales bacterium]|nr:hypothetical protein [Myxococcales bacterium]